ncbi:antitoxin MazE-like protein [Tistrella mobilis]
MTVQEHRTWLRAQHLRSTRIWVPGGRASPSPLGGSGNR